MVEIYPAETRRHSSCPRSRWPG